MTVKELIEELKALDKNQEVMILDGSNGCGVPREINFTNERKISDQDEEDTADCEGKAGNKVFVLGYGFY